MRFVEITARRLGPAPQPEGRARTQRAPPIDKPIAGLLADLKQRGLLKDTLVIWGGEFGRTPYAQGGDGRDHNNKGFTIWMAGGGVKGGLRLRRDRRLRLRGRRGQGPRPRLARDDPAPARPRPREADLPLRRPRLPADRREGERGEGDSGVRKTDPSKWEMVDDATADVLRRMTPGERLGIANDLFAMARRSSAGPGRRRPSGLDGRANQPRGRETNLAGSQLRVRLGRLAPTAR